MAGLTARGYALPPQIPQHGKVVGGGHRVGQLWKHKQRDREGEGAVGVSEVITKSARVQLRIWKFEKKKKEKKFDSSLNSAEVNILPQGFPQ